MNKANKLKTLVAAMLLTTASTASAIGTWQYDWGTTSLDGEVGITSGYTYRGITLNSNPTVFAKLELVGIEGSIEGWYIGAAGIAVEDLDANTEYTAWIGWKGMEAVGWQYDIGLLGTFTDYDEINTNYGEVYGKLGYTWDNEYLPGLDLKISYSDDYYNLFGSTVYYNLGGSFEVPTNYNPVKFYARAGYTDSMDDDIISFQDYGDYKVGVSTKLGHMETDLSVTWIDSNDDFVQTPFGTIDSDNNATVNLTLSYLF